MVYQPAVYASELSSMIPDMIMMHMS